MKIVFIQPKGCSFAEGHLWEPVSFGYLISYAKEFHPDYQYKVMSAGFYKDTEILEECKDADLVCFTATTPQMYHAKELADKIKTKKVFGGVHPTISTKDAFAAGADIVVQGEGEIAFRKILDSLSRGKSPKKIYKEPFIENLDSLPFPDRKAIHQEKYLQITERNDGMKIASITSSRGCPHQCTFCTSRAIWGGKTRFRSAINIIMELSQLISEWNIDFLKFNDDTFTLDRKRVIEFCEMKKGYQMDVPWACNARVNTLDEELLQIMKDAGCVELWLGVESGSERILKVLKKGITKDQVRKVFKAAKKVGIRTRGYFMIGNETETLAEIQETINFVQELDPDIVGISINTPFPGSERWKTMEDDINWKNVDLYRDAEKEGEKVWGNENISGAKLKQIQKEMLDKFKDKLIFRLK